MTIRATIEQPIGSRLFDDQGTQIDSLYSCCMRSELAPKGNENSIVRVEDPQQVFVVLALIDSQKLSQSLDRFRVAFCFGMTMSTRWQMLDFSLAVHHNSDRRIPPIFLTLNSFYKLKMLLDY